MVGPDWTAQNQFCAVSVQFIAVSEGVQTGSGFGSCPRGQKTGPDRTSKPYLKRLVKQFKLTQVPSRPLKKVHILLMLPIFTSPSCSDWTKWGIGIDFGKGLSWSEFRWDPSLSIDIWWLQGKVSARRRGCRVASFKANVVVNGGALSSSCTSWFSAVFKIKVWHWFS